ncbi:methyltransferase domain-containing protein [Patescibacteria group bacterium]|nr:methyltransferase domain-containing protein [Patescibacteria group bacterium]
MLSDQLPSPINGKTAVLQQTLKSSEIITRYSNQFDIAVDRYFAGVPEVGIYRCEATGYRFYYPLTLSGDGIFYEKLQKFSWYYMDWKWEHKIALKLITKNNRILEVGSGNGSFVERLEREGIRAVGLELNAQSVDNARKKRLPIIGETIEQHSAVHPKTYDMVVTFQVLEHIAEVRTFIDACLRVLKPGGRLFVSVPNNRSFISHDQNGILNMPPHHMGLWDRHSLRAVAPLLGIRLVKMYYEPLQPYHVHLYLDIQLTRLENTLPQLKKVLERRIPRGILYRLVRLFRPFIRGHSIAALYQKS